MAADPATVLAAWTWLLRHLRNPHDGEGSSHLYRWEDERDRHLMILRDALGLERRKTPRSVPVVRARK